MFPTEESLLTSVADVTVGMWFLALLTAIGLIVALMCIGYHIVRFVRGPSPDEVRDWQRERVLIRSDALQGNEFGVLSPAQERRDKELEANLAWARRKGILPSV